MFDPTQQRLHQQQEQFNRSHRPEDNDADPNTDPSHALTKPQDLGTMQLKFRTYKPYSKQLKSYRMGVDGQQHLNNNNTHNTHNQSHLVDTDDQWVADEIEPIIRAGERFNQSDFITAYPTECNPTWDLKRDLQPDLAVLDQRTQSAITTMVQQRLLRDNIDAAVAAAMEHHSEADGKRGT